MEDPFRVRKVTFLFGKRSETRIAVDGCISLDRCRCDGLDSSDPWIGSFSKDLEQEARMISIRNPPSDTRPLDPDSHPGWRTNCQPSPPDGENMLPIPFEVGSWTYTDEEGLTRSFVSSAVSGRSTSVGRREVVDDGNNNFELNVSSKRNVRVAYRLRSFSTPRT